MHIMRRLIILLTVYFITGCGGGPPPKLSPVQHNCVTEERVGMAIEIALCGDNVSGDCASESIMARSLERRLLCLEQS